MQRTIILLVLTLCFLLPHAVDAQVTRTWVSANGDDVNPCSRVAPCKTFAGAILKTVAGGEINCLDPASLGAVMIKKSVTIDCTSTTGSILSTTAEVVTIDLHTTDADQTVRLRGLTINGKGIGANGITVISAARVYIEGLIIDGATGHGISAVNTTGDLKIVVRNSSLRNNKVSGINGNATGGTLDILLSGSLISGNSTGIRADGAATTVRLSGNSIAYNTTGLSVGGSGRIVSYKNNLIDGNGTNGTPTTVLDLQ